MYVVHPPSIFRKLYPKAVWSVQAAPKTVYLTFDDGPVTGVTDEILSILRAFDAKATFFCLGKNVVAYPGLFEQLSLEGHSRGNHTFSHPNGWRVPTTPYMKDFWRCDALVPSTLFRPPYGKLRPGQYQAISSTHKIIMWDVLSRDYDVNVSPEECLRIVVRHVKNGSIIVFHDSEKARKKVLFALPKVLEKYSQEGYRFGSLTDTLLSSDSSN